MAKLDKLNEYFPTGTTEGDRQILHRIFVTPEQLPEVLATPSGNPRVLVGNKGVGKTAILEWISAANSKRGIPALFLRPDDLDLAPLADSNDVGTIKRKMYECFLDAVAVSIGERLSGMLRGDEATLYRESVAQGARTPDWMGKLLTLIGGLAKPVTDIDANKLADDLAKQTVNKARLSEVVNRHLLSEQSVFTILVDDTDQIGSPDDPQHLNRLWGLLLAVRKLTSTCPYIKCVVSLRTEVWMRLLRNEYGQRDQIDHFRPLVMWLRAPEDLIKSIFYRRLSLAAWEDGYREGAITEYFFDEAWMNLPKSEERRPWEQFLLKSSRERPRDLIQLVHHLAKAAKERGAESIGSRDAERAMESFSRERAEDLAIEMGFDCGSFLDVIRTFADTQWELSFEELREHLRGIPTRFSVRVHGRILRPDNDDDAIKLLSLIHESGFLNARVRDTRQSLEYRHITFLDDPHLVQMSRWSELQRATWEVHPAFRTYIMSLQKEREWSKRR